MVKLKDLLHKKQVSGAGLKLGGEMLSDLDDAELSATQLTFPSVMSPATKTKFVPYKKSMMAELMNS